MRFTPTRVGKTHRHDADLSTSAVHPHARGENGVRWHESHLNVGSPPRAWGKLGHGEGVVGRARFTPTRVGKTARSPHLPPSRPVHPHARGENDHPGRRQVHVPGSPPRAWGKLADVFCNSSRHRFTPTRVGKTRRLTSAHEMHPVHPHARGENAFSRFFRSVRSGSPPRAWGKRSPCQQKVVRIRFTPTRVGKTERICISLPKELVHPHARGENAIRLHPYRLTSGSPPRAWGKLGRSDSASSGIRFTPTRVGKTATPSTSRRRTPVHPHARGENACAISRNDNPRGSPPRAWGKLKLPAPDRIPDRFTPTRVGKTLRCGAGHRGSSVHPHARGENEEREAERHRVRRFTPTRVGKTKGRKVDFGRCRFTPTRVGKTRRAGYALPRRAVHPHARGENGSSRRSAPGCSWFTPTRVGKTDRAPPENVAPLVHPHARGENSRSRSGTLNNFGSPPRAWGKPGRTPPARPDRWFTPTRVGKTPSASSP